MANGRAGQKTLSLEKHTADRILRNSLAVTSGAVMMERNAKTAKKTMEGGGHGAREVSR